MAATTHKIDAQQSGTTSGGMDYDLEYTITFSFLPGAPDTRDEQGYGPEVEFVSITPDAGDHGAFTDLAQKELEAWAGDWLDEHFDEVVEIAERERADAPL